MKVYEEISLSNFNFWSGAKETAKHIGEKLGEDGWRQLKAILEDAYPDGIDATDLNDLLWFESETVYEWLGIEDEEEDEDEDEE